MFISKIVLENFQAFEKGEFNLSPNLNILVGVSNVGKSSVARALSLILFNQWDKSWCRFGAKYCRVSILTDTGVEVVREKGDKVNRYILHLPNQPEQLFESFGTAVPEQIQQALHIHTVQVDTADTLNLNLAGQMDALFLLSQTGSYRAKVLGKLSGATYLDHAIRELNKDKRQVTAEKNTKDLEVVELQAQVDKFASLEAFSAVIATLEAKLASVAIAEQRLERIRNLFEHVKVLRDAWTRETKKAELLGALDLVSIDQLVNRVDNIKALGLLFSKIANFKRTYLRENKLSELLQAIDLTSISKIAESVTNFKTKNDFVKRFDLNKRELVVMSNATEESELDHRKTTELYTRLLKQNGVCPTCNQATNHLCER